MKQLMRGPYAVAVAFPSPHCVNGSVDIWLRASLVWKATAVVLSVHLNENRHLRSRSDSGVTFPAESGCKVKTTSFNLTGNDNNRKRLARTVLIFTERSAQLSRATDRVPGLPATPGYAQ